MHNPAFIVRLIPEFPEEYRLEVVWDRPSPAKNYFGSFRAEEVSNGHGAAGVNGIG